VVSLAADHLVLEDVISPKSAGHTTPGAGLTDGSDSAGFTPVVL
jgi:hypothetical protein